MTGIGVKTKIPIGDAEMGDQIHHVINSAKRKSDLVT